jgi:hypothetical protein
MIFTLILTGFIALMVGTYRTSRDLLGAASTPARRWRLLLIGYALLAMSLVPVLRDPDWARRLVEWFGDMTIAALLVVLGVWLRLRAPRRS